MTKNPNAIEPVIDVSPFQVREGSTVDLSSWNPAENGGFDKTAARKLTRTLNDRLEALQEKLWAEQRHKVLIVLQATDAGGKDGTIRNVFDGVNPSGVKVASFKKPSSLEMSHDYLWRIHRNAPANGEMVIFNRSHYEDVLVVRVHDLVPPERWEKRYDHIRHFEQMLVDEGTTIVKLYLHISKDEQKERFQSRLDEEEKNWKFSLGDLREREHWDQYQEAFTAALQRTSTDQAPWFVIPSNRKWFRNLLVSQIVVDTLEGLNMEWPETEGDLTGVTISD